MKQKETTKYPLVEINTAMLRENAHRVVATCQRHGVKVTAVTKVVCANAYVVNALIDGGIRSLADSRLSNLQRLRSITPDAELILLRLPMLSQVADVVRWADISLNSESLILDALNQEARAVDKVHGVILMVDVGDLREGIWPDRVNELAKRVQKMENIKIRGVGTNLCCYGGIKPDRNNMETVVRARDIVAETVGYKIEMVSGGSSANWLLMESGDMPRQVNHLRIGEAIMLGTETTKRIPIKSLSQKVFTLKAEVIEVGIKPSVPIGEIGEDAFGNTPRFVDRGRHHRAIVAIGRQDVVPDGLQPDIKGIRILGASSDHMILDVEDAERQVCVGDLLSFTVRGYSALLALFTSGYVGVRRRA